MIQNTNGRAYTTWQHMEGEEFVVLVNGYHSDVQFVHGRVKFVVMGKHGRGNYDVVMRNTVCSREGGGAGRCIS